MKKKFTLIFGASFFLIAASAFGAESNSFSIFGIKIGQQKSALNRLGQFECYDNRPYYDESCSAHLTIQNHPVQMLLSLNNGLVVNLIVNYEHSGAAAYESSVQKAINIYGNPQEHEKYPNNEFVVWYQGHQKYSIRTSGGSMMESIFDTNHLPPPPARPTRQEQPATL